MSYDIVKARREIEATIRDDETKIELAQISIQCGRAILAGDVELAIALGKQQVDLLRDVAKRNNTNDPLVDLGVAALEAGIKWIANDAQKFAEHHAKQVRQ